MTYRWSVTLTVIYTSHMQSQDLGIMATGDVPLPILTTPVAAS